MRNVLALGAAILFVGAASMSIAQERLQSNQSGMGVGEGVGDVSGSSHSRDYLRSNPASRSVVADGNHVWSGDCD